MYYLAVSFARLRADLAALFETSCAGMSMAMIQAETAVVKFCVIEMLKQISCGPLVALNIDVDGTA